MLSVLDGMGIRVKQAGDISRGPLLRQPSPGGAGMLLVRRVTGGVRFMMGQWAARVSRSG